MTVEAELPIKKGWVERTEAAESSVDIDRGGSLGPKWQDLGFKRSESCHSIRRDSLMAFHLRRAPTVPSWVQSLRWFGGIEVSD